MMDVYSRKIVGHEVYENETGELAREFIEKPTRASIWRLAHYPLGFAD